MIKPNGDRVKWRRYFQCYHGLKYTRKVTDTWPWQRLKDTGKFVIGPCESICLPVTKNVSCLGKAKLAKFAHIVNTSVPLSSGEKYHQWERGLGREGCSQLKMAGLSQNANDNNKWVQLLLGGRRSGGCLNIKKCSALAFCQVRQLPFLVCSVKMFSEAGIILQLFISEMRRKNMNSEK